MRLQVFALSRISIRKAVPTFRNALGANQAFRGESVSAMAMAAW
jgi:hypothetical protein